MPPLMIMMVGLPGSGKTTVADELHRLMVAAGYECKILSSDGHIERVAAEQGRSYQDVFPEQISEASRLMWRDAKRAKSQQVSVIWDRANHQRGARAKVLEFFPSPYKRVAAVMPTSASEAALRNEKRSDERAVPFNEMNLMTHKSVTPRLNEGFDLVLDKCDLLGECPFSSLAIAGRYWELMWVLL